MHTIISEFTFYAEKEIYLVSNEHCVFWRARKIRERCLRFPLGKSVGQFIPYYYMKKEKDILKTL